MRLIDADALKKRIDEVCNYRTAGSNGLMRKAVVQEVNVLIDNAPTMPLPDFKEGYKQAILDGKTNYSRPQGEWIPVSERLPEGDESYIITYKSYGENVVAESWFNTSYGFTYDNVIAWMPLPEPYKGEQNND